MNFVAIDFETADCFRDSACAVGVVKVEGDKITERRYQLIKPPRRQFTNTWVHGIAWSDVANAPTFEQFWPELKQWLNGFDFIAAHNYSFDRSVLNACCRNCNLEVPEHQALCTMKLARSAWNIRPTRLDNVCDHLGIKLNHHHALSDAEACARIAIRAKEFIPAMAG